jgi:AcrR family transcriptional regulator
MSKRDQQKQKNRQKIIDAYINLLSRLEFQNITVTDICDEAEVARKTLYSHFSSKEEILDHVSEMVMFTGSISAFTETLTHFSGTKQRLDATFAQLSIPLSTYNGENIAVFVQLIQNMTMRLPSYSGKFTEYRQAAYHYFSDCQQNTDTKDSFDVDFIADLTVNASVGIILSWVSDPSYPASRRMEQLKQHIADLILRT